MDEELRKTLEKLFPGQNVNDFKIYDASNLGEIPTSVRYDLRKKALFAVAEGQVSYDSLIPGYYKFLEIASIEPKKGAEYDKGKRYLARINWKEHANEPYDEEFWEQIRINSMLYQVNADRFLQNMSGLNVSLNRWGSPDLCLSNFELLLGKEIFVEKVLITNNDKGQKVYEIFWEFHS